MPPVVLITSSEPAFSSNNPPSDGGLQNPTEKTDIIPIIAGAVGGGALLIVFITILLCAVVFLVNCNSSRNIVFTKEDACEQEKTDLEKGSGVNKQSEVENYKSDIKLKSFTQKVDYEEPTIDPEKCNGTAVSKPTTVGNTKRNKPDKQKPPQPNVACDDSEIATEKGKLADANSTTTTTTTTTTKITIRAAKTTKPTKTPETTTTTTVMIAKPTSASAPMTTKTKMATKTKTAETTTVNKSGNATSNVQGKSSLHVKKPETNKLKPAPLPPTSRRDESTSQPVSKKQENVVTSQKKTGNRSEPRKNSSSADQITAPSERTSGLVKQLPPLGKPSGATKKQGVNSGEEYSETSLIQILLGPK